MPVPTLALQYRIDTFVAKVGLRHLVYDVFHAFGGSPAVHRVVTLSADRRGPARHDEPPHQAGAQGPAGGAPRNAPRRSGKATREAILAGAFDALTSEGLPNLSYDRIAQAAGTSRQLVRYHFPDGDALMVALCDRLAEAYREALLSEIATLPPGAPRLGVFLDYYFDLLDGRAKPRDDAVYDAMMSRAAGSPEVRGRLRDQYALLGQILTHEIVLSHPSLDSARAAEISWLFVTLMYGHWKMVASLGFSESHRTITRRAIDRLIASYLEDGDPDAAIQVWSTKG
jgi:AcrR family transcriptional regulator